MLFSLCGCFPEFKLQTSDRFSQVVTQCNNWPDRLGHLHSNQFGSPCWWCTFLNNSDVVQLWCLSSCTHAHTRSSRACAKYTVYLLFFCSHLGFVQIHIWLFIRSVQQGHFSNICVHSREKNNLQSLSLYLINYVCAG